MVDSRYQNLSHSTRNNHYCFHSIVDQFNSLLYCWAANKFCVLEFFFKLDFIFSVFIVKDVFINPNSPAIWNLSWLNQILIRKLNNSNDSFMLIFLIYLNVNNLKAEERQQKYFLLLPVAPIRRKLDISSRSIFLIQKNLKKDTFHFFIIKAIERASNMQAFRCACQSRPIMHTVWFVVFNFNTIYFYSSI